MGELVSNGVQIYQFPTDDEAVAEINAVMNVSVGQGPRTVGPEGLQPARVSDTSLGNSYSTGFQSYLLQEGQVGIWESVKSYVLWTGTGGIEYWTDTEASLGLSFTGYGVGWGPETCRSE